MLFHVHTRYSFDGILPLRHILRYCKKHGIDILVITDHDSTRAFQKAGKLAGKYGITIIPGVEYSSDAGDIIGLFIKDKSKSKHCNEILRFIRQRGGLSVLPHPMKGHNLDMVDFGMIDLIEVFNPRCSPEENGQAKQLGLQYNKPQLTGADAHLPWELGLTLNRFTSSSSPPSHTGNWTEEDLKKLLLTNPRDFICKPSTEMNYQISQLVKSVKRPDLRLMYRSLKGILKGLFFNR